nr:pentatricopeptide repeat-containing protein At3g50420 [Ipomoea batatas]
MRWLPLRPPLTLEAVVKPRSSSPATPSNSCKGVGIVNSGNSRNIPSYSTIGTRSTPVDNAAAAPTTGSPAPAPSIPLTPTTGSNTMVNGNVWSLWCGTPTVEAVDIDMEENGGGGGAGNPHYRRRRRRRCRRRLSLAASTETTTYGSFRFFDRTRISLGPRLLIKNPDLVSWNSMIARYAENGDGEKAVRVFVQFLRRSLCKPDEYSFAAVISVTCMLPAADYGKPLHAKSEKSGLQSSVYVGSTPGGQGIASP